MAATERIMFVSSNGTGLGHLTRSMAIARRLDAGLESLFVTLSRAAPVVRDMGFPVEYAASHGSVGAGSDFRWSRRMSARLKAAVDEAQPRILVFDGILPYDPLLAAMRRVPLTVWCRRGLWQRGASTAPLTRSDLFDAILEPGEFADRADAGPTSARRAEAHQVAPIVFLDDSEVLPRAEAARELGLEEEKPSILVQLGQGAEVAGATDRCLRALAGRDDVQVAAASSAIAGLLEVPDGMVHLRSSYPMSRYYAAFDGAVSAAGYNAFHELVRFGIPTVFVPMRRETDDQPARARYAEEVGVGLAVDGPGDARIARRLNELVDADRRRAMREHLRELRPDNGAAEAARWLASLLPDSHHPSSAPTHPSSGAKPALAAENAPFDEEGGPSRHAPRRSAQAARAWVFVRTLPRTIARLIGQTLWLPRPRTIVLALGAEEGAVLGAIRGAQDPPERVLVVTDSLAIGEAWRAGTGVEHIPGPGEPQAAMSGLEYDEFRRRRLGLILVHRARLRHAIDVGEVPADLHEAVLAPPRRRARLLIGPVAR
ncbi:MAG TPA: glycosyltransferase [Solirubrobacterales bacterium]|jgi:UDP:flavonoid glycosyltransferase YjiC (YdhE family)|nr:glycosyltransferase [Solirubrobacterales bacterium]